MRSTRLRATVRTEPSSRGRLPCTRFARSRRSSSTPMSSKHSASATSRCALFGRRSPSAYTRRVDFELSAEQREIQSLARDFAREQIEPHASEWDRARGFPRELLGKLGEVGLLGVCVPEEQGGGGADFLSYILVIEELSRADAGVGVTVAVHTSACTLPIIAFGTPEQQAEFVPALARGEAIGAFALTESSSGSDAGSLKTRAERNRAG